MSAQKPIYSRPSDDEPAPAPRKRKRRHKRKNAALTAVNESFTPHEDDGVAFHDPITEAKSIAKRAHLQDDGVTKRDPTTGAHHTRNQRTHHREKRRARELRAENERLHRRLAAIYDALGID